MKQLFYTAFILFFFYSFLSACSKENTDNVSAVKDTIPATLGTAKVVMKNSIDTLILHYIRKAPYINNGGDEWSGTEYSAYLNATDTSLEDTTLAFFVAQNLKLLAVYYQEKTSAKSASGQTFNTQPVNERFYNLELSANADSLKIACTFLAENNINIQYAAASVEIANYLK